MIVLASVVLAVVVTVWAYGVYCYIQMVRYRQPGVPALSLVWPAERLTERGLEFRRRALLSYAVFAVLALLLVIVGSHATQ